MYVSKKIQAQRSHISGSDSFLSLNIGFIQKRFIVQFLRKWLAYLLIILGTCAFQLGVPAIAVRQESQISNRHVQMSQVRQITETLKNSDSLTFKEVVVLQSRWEEAVRRLLDGGSITKGMTVQSLLEVMGEPSKQGDGFLQWYFASPRHINPGLIVHVVRNQVTKAQLSYW